MLSSVLRTCSSTAGTKVELSSAAWSTRTEEFSISQPCELIKCRFNLTSDTQAPIHCLVATQPTSAFTTELDCARNYNYRRSAAASCTRSKSRNGRQSPTPRVHADSKFTRNNVSFTSIGPPAFSASASSRDRGTPTHSIPIRMAIPASGASITGDDKYYHTPPMPDADAHVTVKLVNEEDDEEGSAPLVNDCSLRDPLSR
jgi:hypothetical protein